jgi:hypothetical protein
MMPACSFQRSAFTPDTMSENIRESSARPEATAMAERARRPDYPRPANPRTGRPLSVCKRWPAVSATASATRGARADYCSGQRSTRCRARTAERPRYQRRRGSSGARTREPRARQRVIGACARALSAGGFRRARRAGVSPRPNESDGAFTAARAARLAVARCRVEAGGAASGASPRHCRNGRQATVRGQMGEAARRALTAM